MTARLEPAHGSPHFPRPLERSRGCARGSRRSANQAPPEVGGGIRHGRGRDADGSSTGDLVTNAALDQRLTAFRYELMAEMHREFREQTWRLMTAMLAAMGTLVGAMGIFVALAKL